MNRTASNRQKRRIAVITGTRAEYGLLQSSMHAIDQHRNLKLQLVVTGMHLLRKFGHTVSEIQKDGWPIDARVKMQTGNDDPIDQAQGLAKGIAGIATFVEQAHSDIVLVLGDRIEAMAGALAAVTTGRMLAHIHGGDVAPGDVDDSIRNAITKMSHLHLCATKRARQRVIAMGEQADRAVVVGAPGLDDLGAIAKRCKLQSGKSGRALILQHPSGRSADREGRVMTSLLRAVDDVGLEPVIVYPNSDRGHDGIVKAIESHQCKNQKGQVQIVRSMKRNAFLHTLMDVDVLVGNSSSGIIESATAGTAAVNVGLRQRGRERSGPAVLDVAENRTSIREGLKKALRKRPIIGRPTVYGDGQAGTKIAAQLAKMPLSESFRKKL